MSVKKRRKSFVIMLLTLCLVLTFPASVAMAANSLLQSSLLQNQAANRMAKLKLIFGYGDGDLVLNDNLTRAELVTVLVRAFGQDSNAKLVQGAPSFSDVRADAWYSGSIAIAKNLVARNGDTLGFPNGTFAPNENVTAAEAVAFMMKFLGLRPDPTNSWPANYIDAALQNGLITAGDRNNLAPMVNQKVTRGLVFSLLDQAFSTYPVDGKKNVYQTYIDDIPPLVFVDVPTETFEPSITVSGKAIDASELRVNTTLVSLGSDGSFSYVLPLIVGKENSIQIWAKDAAGNELFKTFVVKHRYGDPALIEAADLTVPAGETVDLGAAVMDKYGNKIPDAAIVVESSLGTYSNGKFTATQKAGAGTATLKAGSTAGKEIVKTIKVKVIASTLAKVEADKTSAALGEGVQLKAVDQYGNAITDGVTWSQTSGDAILDANPVVFIGMKAGKYTVTAKKDEKIVTGTVEVYGQAVKLIVSIPTSLEEGQSGAVFVKVVDQFGSFVPTYNGKIYAANASYGINVSVGEVKNGVASGSIGAVYSGSYTFDIRTADELLKSETQSINVTPRPVPVYIPPANHAPVWSTIPDQTYNGDPPHDISTLDLSGFVHDPDSDSLTFSTSSLPQGVTLSGSVLIIDTHNPHATGIHTITVTASDGKTSISKSFTWDIRVLI